MDLPSRSGPMSSISAVKNWLFVHLPFIVLPDASLSPAEQRKAATMIELPLFSSRGTPFHQ